MDEEVKIDDGISEWEASLPSAHDLTPLSQSLIPAEFASAFRISPEPSRTAVDVGHASRSTLSSIHGGASLEPFGGHVMEEAETDPKKSRRTDGVDEKAAKSLKRPRLVWTPQLHRRFVDVVAHLGLKNAVPKTIMQLMNVEGLTRENVASHLQKYRLYVKRMQGLSNEGASPSDHLFASTPLPPHESSIGNGNGSSGNNEGGMSYPQIMVGYESAHYQRQYQQIDCSPNTFHGYPHHSII